MGLTRSGAKWRQCCVTQVQEGESWDLWRWWLKKGNGWLIERGNNKGERWKPDLRDSLSLSRCFSFFRRKGLREGDKRDPIYWGRRGENGERLLQVVVSSLLSTPPSHPMPMPPVFFYVYICFACISFSFFTKRKLIYFSKLKNIKQCNLRRSMCNYSILCQRKFLSSSIQYYLSTNMLGNKV